MKNVLQDSQKNYGVERSFEFPEFSGIEAYDEILAEVGETRIVAMVNSCLKTNARNASAAKYAFSDSKKVKAITYALMHDQETFLATTAEYGQKSIQVTNYLIDLYNEKIG